MVKPEKRGSKSSGLQVPEINIQSKSHEQLLNTIDHLRAQGLSSHVSLPQLIVCGDQSSGKSSVLEAVSSIKFPSADETCTRFATELVLRRASAISSSISIIPDAKRSEEEQKVLQDFKIKMSVSEEFPQIIEEAKRLMGIRDSGSNRKAIGADRLRIEITGPKQPHLTLVDLPGLVHASSKTLTKDDVKSVKSLVFEYMENPRSIILAVITAKNDFNNQVITAHAKQYDPELKRTLGIITKPDDLPDGSARQKAFRNLVENKSEYLSLGWHILKNREHGQQHFTSEERDESEEKFFNSNSWKTLDMNLKGVSSLRPRLSKVLQEQILTELPNLTEDVRNAIDEAEAVLSGLGSARASYHEQRIHLHNISQAFTKLVRNGVNGHYVDEFFLIPNDRSGYAKRIRAGVFNTLDRFSQDLELKGHKFQVVGGPSIEENATSERQQRKSKEVKKFPIKILRNERLQEVEKLIKQNRGLELPGFMKADTITHLFRDQCSPWQDLAKLCAQSIYNQAQRFIMLCLAATADISTRDNIFRVIIKPRLDEVKNSLRDGVKETLKQHLYGVPITFNNYFTDNIQQLRQEHNAQFIAQRLGSYFGTQPMSEDKTLHIATGRDVNTHDLVQMLAKSTEADTNTFACSEGLYFMEAYYKVARKFFVDDFTIHAVEHSLMEKLPNVFDPSEIFNLDEEAIRDIAGETEESVKERLECNKKLEVLRGALNTLNGFERASTDDTKSFDLAYNSDEEMFF